MKGRTYFLIFSWLFLLGSCSENTVAQKDGGRTPNTQIENRAENTNSSSPVPSEKNVDSNLAPDAKENAANWKTYRDKEDGFSFRYPSNLTLQKRKNQIRLFHSIKFEHRDPCDQSDNPPLLKDLIDFDVSFEIVGKNFDAKDFDSNGMSAPFDLPKLSGEVVGKSKWYNYEGCGMYEYIYPLKEGKTLIFREQIIGFFSSAANPEAETTPALKDPNLIKNDDELITQILGSFKYEK